MMYRFKDIFNPELYNSGLVVLITGPHALFNNLVSDAIKANCKGEYSDIQINEESELFQEFIVGRNDYISGNDIDFKRFLELTKMAALDGKWFCVTDITMLSNKQKETFEKYIRNPSINGVLVVVAHEYKQYVKYLRNKVFKASPKSHLIQLSFPSRNELELIVKKKFMEHDVDVDDRAIDLFILKMGNDYDGYIDMIKQIATDNEETGIVRYKEMAYALKGVENYVFEDFIIALTRPMKNTNVVKTRKIYKVANVLIAEYGVSKLISMLRRKINDLIEMRTLINTGIVPVKIRYSVEECKKFISEDSNLHRLHNITFRKLADTASKTTLMDWVIIKIMLENIKNKHNQGECAKALYAIMNRSVYSEERILNNLGFKDEIEDRITAINNIDGVYDIYTKLHN